jgi:hypothetical protein
MTEFHPTRQFRPAAPNVGFAPHCRRSDAPGLTSQTDPEPTFMASPADGRVNQEAAVRMDSNPLHATIDPFF